MKKQTSVIFALLIIFGIVTFTGCKPLNDPEDYAEAAELAQEEPAMIIHDDSKLDIRVSYLMTDDPDNVIEAVIPSGSDYEIEDGVKEITIDGYSL